MHREGLAEISGECEKAAREERRDKVTYYFTMFFSDLFNAMPLESKGFSDYTFNEHESYPPFLSDCHQQELLDLIHAFKFLYEHSTHKFV